jgi:hypothetical protein
MNEYAYQLRNCSDPGNIIWTKSDLAIAGLLLGSFFQSQEYPGVCWEIIDVIPEQDYTGPTEEITPVGPIFVNCTDCQNGVLEGCTDPEACNFNPCATIDDGSCFYNNVTIRILCNDPITTCDINANCN